MNQKDKLIEISVVHIDSFLNEIMAHEQYKNLSFPDGQLIFMIDTAATLVINILHRIIKQEAPIKRKEEFIDFVSNRAKQFVEIYKDKI